jgi:hypothetical protein
MSKKEMERTKTMGSGDVTLTTPINGSHGRLQILRWVHTVTSIPEKKIALLYTQNSVESPLLLQSSS